MWLGCGSDVARMWFGCGSDVVGTWLGRVFGSGRDSLAEVKGKWFPGGPRPTKKINKKNRDTLRHLFSE